jgi:VWFA-related protein
MALILLAALMPGQEVLVFEADTAAVYVDVFVTRDGKPVPGLTARQFEVEDEGIRHSLEMVSLEDVPLDVYLVFDVSMSLRGERLEHLRRAARVVLAELRPGDRAGLFTFSDEVRLAVPPTSDLNVLGDALTRLEASGTTSLHDALFAALVLGGGPGRGVAIVFSDGEDRTSWLSEREVLEAAEPSNVLLHAVGILPVAGAPAEDTRERPLPAGLRFLNRLTEATGGALWLAASTEDLEATFRRVLEAMHNRYVLRFEPRTFKPGRHRLTVKLKGVEADIRSRPSYFVAR